MLAWFRTKKTLIAVLDDKRRLQQQIETLNAENNDLDERLVAAAKDRTAAGPTIEPDRKPTRQRHDPSGPPSPPSLHRQLLRETARANKLAHLVDQLQAANMAMDQPR
ncbi:hypothetical protein AB0F17_58640 [Nonomuraea sp. NPDC026600]|uniref:hypothetical protein n=1 Tax=Nonomuraea sp. NPDC026600 TaxID=3155363 RepID=UPI0033D30294